jgi:hypothetical protein
MAGFTWRDWGKPRKSSVSIHRGRLLKQQEFRKKSGGWLWDLDLRKLYRSLPVYCIRTCVPVCPSLIVKLKKRRILKSAVGTTPICSLHIVVIIHYEFITPKQHSTFAFWNVSTASRKIKYSLCPTKRILRFTMRRILWSSLLPEIKYHSWEPYLSQY